MGLDELITESAGLVFFGSEPCERDEVFEWFVVAERYSPSGPVVDALADRSTGGAVSLPIDRRVLDTSNSARETNKGGFLSCLFPPVQHNISNLNVRDERVAGCLGAGVGSGRSDQISAEIFAIGDLYPVPLC